MKLNFALAMAILAVSGASCRGKSKKVAPVVETAEQEPGTTSPQGEVNAWSCAERGLVPSGDGTRCVAIPARLAELQGGWKRDEETRLPEFVFRGATFLEQEKEFVTDAGIIQVEQRAGTFTVADGKITLRYEYSSCQGTESDDARDQEVLIDTLSLVVGETQQPGSGQPGPGNGGTLPPGDGDAPDDGQGPDDDGTFPPNDGDGQGVPNDPTPPGPFPPGDDGFPQLPPIVIDPDKGPQNDKGDHGAGDVWLPFANTVAVQPAQLTIGEFVYKPAKNPTSQKIVIGCYDSEFNFTKRTLRALPVANPIN